MMLQLTKIRAVSESKSQGLGRSIKDVRTFRCKNIGFFEIYGVFARTWGRGGLSQYGHLANKREGEINFSRFCADVFYGRPLSYITDLQRHLLFLCKYM